MLGLWEKRDVAAGTFSKGMKQKLAIARALIHDPQVLFMDEPTANLDPESSKTVRDFILELKKEKRTDLPQHAQPRRGAEDLRQDRDTEHQADGAGHPAGARGSRCAARKTVIQLDSVNEAILAAARRIGAGERRGSWKATSSYSTSRTRTKENPDIVHAIDAAGGRIGRSSR